MEAILLAQDTVESAIWKELLSYGVLGIFALAVGLGIWRFASYITDRLFSKDDGIVPYVVKKHFDTIERLTETSERAVAMQDEHAKAAATQAQAFTAIAEAVQTKLDPKGDPRYEGHIFSTVSTNEAILHLASAANQIVDNPVAKSHILQAMKAVERG